MHQPGTGHAVSRAGKNLFQPSSQVHSSEIELVFLHRNKLKT